MTRPFLSLTRLPYDDSAWRVELCASNGQFMGTQEFYTHEEELINFGEQLERFPKDINDEVVFKQGEPSKDWFYFLLVRAFIFDSLGHAAVEIATSNNADSPCSTQVRFSILTEVAAINAFGQSIKEWITDTQASLKWTPTLL